MTPSVLYVRLVLAAAFWGGTFIAGRVLAPLVDPVTAAFLRFALASSLLLAWLYVRRRSLPRLGPRQLIAVTLLGGTGVLAYNLLFFGGLQSVEAGRAALIVALNPVVIALASVWLFGERLCFRQVTGIVLSLFGAFIVIGRGEPSTLLRGDIGSGELLLLGCVVSWVLYTLIGKRLLHHLSPLVAVTYASIAGTLMLGVLVVWRGGFEAGLFANPAVWGSLAYLAVFGTVLAFVWYYDGVQAIGAGRAGQFINLVPVSGVLLGVLLLGEPLTGSLVLGGALVVVGLWLTSRRQVPVLVVR